jgi:hypothetical protein
MSLLLFMLGSYLNQNLPGIFYRGSVSMSPRKYPSQGNLNLALADPLMTSITGVGGVTSKVAFDTHLRTRKLFFFLTHNHVKV